MRRPVCVYHRKPTVVHSRPSLADELDARAAALAERRVELTAPSSLLGRCDAKEEEVWIWRERPDGTQYRFKTWVGERCPNEALITSCANGRTTRRCLAHAKRESA